MTALEPDQLAERGASGDAIDGHAHVALEFGQGTRGPITEDPVHAARVESQRAQSLLQVDDIVAAQHGGAAVEEAIAEAKAGFDQDVPRLGPADAIHPEATEVLERLDGRSSGIAEEPVGVDRCATVEDGDQPTLHVGDRVSLVAEGEREDYRYAAISWRS